MTVSEETAPDWRLTGFNPFIASVFRVRLCRRRPVRRRLCHSGWTAARRLLPLRRPGFVAQHVQSRAVHHRVTGRARRALALAAGLPASGAEAELPAARHLREIVARIHALQSQISVQFIAGGTIAALAFAEHFFHLAAQPVGQLEGLIATAGEHLAGGLLGQRLQAALVDLIRQIASALRRLGEKFFGGPGVVAQFVLKLAERIGHVLFRGGQFLQGQLVLAAPTAPGGCRPAAAAAKSCCAW